MTAKVVRCRIMYEEFYKTRHISHRQPVLTFLSLCLSTFKFDRFLKGGTVSLLSQATAGTLARPLIYTKYGPNGVGKTTLACAFPKPFIADLEDGSGFISGVSRLGPKKLTSFDAVLALVHEFLNENSEYKTFIIDSVESLETLINQKICKDHNVTSIDDLGFGKGLVLARQEIEAFMKLLQRMRDEKSMNIILVAHSVAKPFTDPNGNVTYDRYIIRANEKFANIIKDLSDTLLFITYKVDTVAQKGKEKVKAYGDGERVIFTQWRPSHDAKSRYPLDYEITFTLDEVDKVVEKLIPSAPEDVYAQCLNLIPQIKDESLRAKAKASLEENKDNVTKLVAIKNRLEELK